MDTNSRNNGLDQIDLFYFINLERRKDRLEQIMEELSKMQIPINKIVRIIADDNKVGILGCTKSHC